MDKSRVGKGMHEQIVTLQLHVNRGLSWRIPTHQAPPRSCKIWLRVNVSSISEVKSCPSTFGAHSIRMEICGCLSNPVHVGYSHSKQHCNKQILNELISLLLVTHIGNLPSIPDDLDH